MIDTKKLMEAHAKVVDLAHREASQRDELIAMRENAARVQADIDAIAEQMIAAATPVEAVAIAAVAEAIAPVDLLPTVDAVEPHATSLEAAIAAMAANAPQ